MDEQVSCYLCHGHTQAKLTSPLQWKNDDARKYAATIINMPEDSLVCPACRKDITRVLSDSSHVPRWTKLSSEKECCVQECTSNVFASFQKTTSVEMEQVFNSVGLKCSYPSVPVPVPLCTHHYHLLYNLMQPRQEHCVTCGASLRRQTNPKACPQPALIERHLKETVGFEGAIRESDKVCYTCYRSHLVILQQGNDISRDSELITTLSQQVPTSIGSTSDLIDAAMTRVVIAVGRELLNGNVMLLPDVHDLIVQFICMRTVSSPA